MEKKMLNGKVRNKIGISTATKFNMNNLHAGFEISNGPI